MTRLSYLLRVPLLCLINAVSMESSSLAVAKDRLVEGRIIGFECGDNCYLTIATKSKTEQAGLCTAPECAKWNEVAAMPPRFKGKRVVVTTGQGAQFDGEGNVVGQMMAFKKIRFLD